MKSILLEKSLQLSVQIMNWSSSLNFGDSLFIKNQIQRSCTSIGAHVREANSSKSSKDFINKLKTAFQELEETEYWIRIISETLNQQPTKNIIDLSIECRKLLCSSIATASRNQKSKA
ncbi:MAG: four helix bundle protein [Flavobacteriales bacterium]|jgi:four helix bundle protein